MDDDQSNDRAIIIGINNYTNYYGKINSLEHAVNDAYQIRKFLEEEIGVSKIYYFADNCPDTPEMEEITIGEKTISRMLFKPSYVNLSCFFLENFKKPFLNGKGKIWFFFSGHGQNINSKQYLMASDSKHNDSAYALDIDFITGKLRDSGASDVVMFVDACRIKVVGKGKSIEPKSQRGVITFWSCSVDERSFEIPAINHGVFTKALLDGLNYKGTDNYATVERLDKYLQQRVRSLLDELKIAEVQTPCLRVEPIIKQKLILLEKIASQDDIKEYPIQTTSKYYLFINKILLLMNKHREKHKLKFSASYLLIGSLTAIFSIIFSYFSLYEGAIKLIIGGENISWENDNPKLPNTLNKKFEWSSGTNQKNSLQVLSKNTLRVNASPGTEYWRNVSDTTNLPPTVSFPINRDFDATVKVKLDTIVSLQRAYFGVRDSKKKYRQILIYLLENSRVEAAYVDEDVPGVEGDNTYMLVNPPIPVKNGSAYFRISKNQNNFELFYSENGIQWTTLSKLPSNTLPHEYEKCELFFTVISTNKSSSAIGDFSNLSIKYLQ